MRKFSRVVTIPAGQTWPQAEAGVGSVPVATYRWLHVQNRGALNSGNDLVIGIAHNPVQNRDDDYYLSCPAGTTLTHNIAGYSSDGELEANALSLLNVGAGAIRALVEMDDEPIVHMSGLIGANPINPNASVTSTPPGGTAQLSVGDTSQFNQETAANLGAGASFLGPWRDCAAYNWAAALSMADVAHTLAIDEADAAVPTIINLVAAQAAAAPAANNANSPAAGFVARVVPTKTVLRFVRVRVINGAGVTTRLNVQSSLSPLN